jgi:hypothetical protein
MMFPALHALARATHPATTLTYEVCGPPPRSARSCHHNPTSLPLRHQSCVVHAVRAVAATAAAGRVQPVWLLLQKPIHDGAVACSCRVLLSKAAAGAGVLVRPGRCA